MALEQEIKAQLAQYLELLESDIVFNVSSNDSENSKKLVAFVQEIVEMSPRLTMQNKQLKRTPSFAVDTKDQVSGIEFAGIPLGHEFTSLVLAILQVSGRAPKIDAKLVKQIKEIKQELNFETFVSLSCHNCPDVVQALNIMSVLNPQISHTMIEGSMFKDEAEAKGIMAVPAVLLNGEEFVNGRTNIEDLLEKIVGPQDNSDLENKEPFDVLVVGGGPAGASAAIYAARKGIRTGIVTDNFGGQPLETQTIENIIGTKSTEGTQFMALVEDHVNEYNVDIIKNAKASAIKKADLVELTLENGTTLTSKTVVLATGARWRNLGIPGEQEFKNKGVAYCPHCDGPMFEGKDVAVVGGGNSGIEAAIDLAGLANHVTVLEFMPELKADQVLQERLYSLKNVTVLKNVQTKEISGDGKVETITYLDRKTNEETTLSLQGVFILIGLQPNTEWLNDSLECTKIGEIIVDKYGATNMPGVYAAGDCTDSAYKQIIISMGSGATAALGAFDYIIRNY
ncbi:alkyl hydroperoxide reductase subunit F [Erysipelotrichaceae bacterium OttesenSCG-928-M19]|nr:alkyl hydroperoxide reductase subunit F [Erysipelotrichaceae bacterium OttesenSCG-928-M19]